MPADLELFTNILAGYRHQASIILHPTFDSAFEMDKEEMPNRMPFHCVEQGKCIVTLDGESYTLEEGDFIAVMQGSAHRIYYPDEEMPVPTILICGYFEFPAGRSRLLMDCFPKVSVIPSKDIMQSQQMKTVTMLLLAEVNSDQPGSKAAADSLANLFFTYLLRTIASDMEVDSGLLAALTDKNLSKALTAFHNAFHESWTLGSLAKVAGMSRTKFVLHFRKILGVTPGTYITQWRLNWAASQLLESDDSIYDIALTTGYQSDAAFSRIFRKQFGISPSEYRKRF